MSLPDTDAQIPDIEADEFIPHRALLQLTEIEPVEGQKAGFTVGLALSHQDPSQPQIVDEETGQQTLALVDITMMALTDILKTTPANFITRINAIQDRYRRLAQAIKDGEDPREAAGAIFGGELVPDTEEPFRVWRDGDWTILLVNAGGTSTTSSFTDEQVEDLIASLRTASGI